VQALREGSITFTPPLEPPVKKHRGKAIRQITASFIANIGPMNTGLIFGFSAVCLPQLIAPSSSIPIDLNQASWIGELF
jgi:SP family facilitated glucose transporter-like MFS transporter 8